jgi:ethanolaminephosphotransferase
MYGDNTWLKLFPNMFARADSTSNFFVSVSHKRPIVAYSRSV